MKFILFFLFIFSFSFQISSFEGKFRVENHLVKILSGPEGGIYHDLKIILDKNNDILGFKRVTKATNVISQFSLDQLVEKEVALGTIKHPKGDLLKPFILKCPNCDATQGGDLIIKYLRSGVNPKRLKYRNFEIKLVREGDHWFLYYKNTKIKNLKLISRKIFGNLVGIKKIKVNP